MINFLKRYSHALILLYYIVIAGVFSNLEKSTKPLYYMYSRFDDYIPFVKVFIIPYLAWFVYIAVTMVYFGLKSRQNFLKLSIHMFIGMTISFVIYWLYPNGQNLRPELIGNDIFTNVIRSLYLYDTPTNSAPSMHVLIAMAVHFSIADFRQMKYRKYIVSSSFCLMMLIISSTVLIKQHSIIDVMWGAIISIMLYVIIYKTNYAVFFNRIKRLMGILEMDEKKKAI